MEEEKPGVCVAILILKGDKVLLGRRKNSRGEGLYAFPGGNLGFKESYQDCASREVREECGKGLLLKIMDEKFPFAAVPKLIDGATYVPG